MQNKDRYLEHFVQSVSGCEQFMFQFVEDRMTKPEEYSPPTSVMNEWRKQCSCDERYRPCDGVMAGGS